jgi:hypothetical protein
MKNIYIPCLLIFLTCTQLNAQSDNITISEKGYTTICGRLLVVDAIWVSEGIIHADISLQDNPNSKAITGGYKKGDEITISSKEGCTYYIFSVVKSGIDSSIGKITLSKSPPLMAVSNCEENLYLGEGSSFAVDTLDWNIYSINEAVVYVKVSYKTAYISEIKLTQGDKIWMGECLYRVHTIIPSWWDKEKNPEGYYEKNPPEVILRKIKNSVYGR